MFNENGATAYHLDVIASSTSGFFKQSGEKIDFSGQEQALTAQWANKGVLLQYVAHQPSQIFAFGETEQHMTQTSHCLE